MEETQELAVRNWRSSLIRNQDNPVSKRSRGRWNPDLQMVALIVPRGRDTFARGISQSKGPVLLFPEEAMDLQQTGVLEIYTVNMQQQEIMLSVQEFQETAFNSTTCPSPGICAAYRMLTRNQWIVRRRKEYNDTYSVPKIWRKGESLEVAYDLYPKSSTFAKARPPPATFSITFCDFRDEAPSLKDLQQFIIDNKPINVQIGTIDASHDLLLYTLTDRIPSPHVIHSDEKATTPSKCEDIVSLKRKKSESH